MEMVSMNEVQRFPEKSTCAVDFLHELLFLLKNFLFEKND